MARAWSTRSTIHRALKVTSDPMMGEDVKALQAALNKRAAARSLPRVKVDGIMGDRTRASARVVGYALGATTGTLRKAEVTVGLQRIIRYPAARNPAQLVRARQRKVSAPRQYETKHRPTGHRSSEAPNHLLLVGRAERISGHYSASLQDRSTRDARSKVEGLAAYHEGKWGDWLEYHAVITISGDIIWNRPSRLMGYGVGGHNTGTLHVLMLGTTGDRPSVEQAKTLRWLLENWHTDRVPAEFRTPRDVSGLPVIPHTDFSGWGGNTLCPGLFAPVYRTKGLSW